MKVDKGRGRTRRSGGRNSRRSARAGLNTDMLPTLQNEVPPVELMDDDQVRQVDSAAYDVLEEVGVVFRDEIALQQWRAAGAKVDEDRVHLDREHVRALLETLPKQVTLTARNPERSVDVGGTSAIFVPMTGAPFIRDLDDQRREPTMADLEMFHRLAHMSPGLHSTAHHIVEPMDLPVSHRHLSITLSSILNSDKTFMGMTTSGRNAEDVLDMCAILFGQDTMERQTVVTGNINGNSPLVWDETMLSSLRAFTARNQPVLVSPFVMAGANTPASTLAAAVQLHAEALSGLAYTQVVRAGAPAIYGHFLSTVSMRSGAPMAGTPEISHLNFIIGQLARLYDLPWRTSNTLGGAKTFDAQSGYESATTLMAVLMAGANYIWHSAGWNEAGLHCSVAKFVVDAEQCAMGHRMASGLRWDDFEEALAAVRDIGPGGHYLGHPHTLANFDRAFFMSDLFDNNSFEQWRADGSKDLSIRAREYARRMLAEYEQPELDDAVKVELEDFVARRRREIPAFDGLNQTH